MLSAAEERPWLWVVYVLTVALPLVLIFVFCCTGKVTHAHCQPLSGMFADGVLGSYEWNCGAAAELWLWCVCDRPQRSAGSAQAQLSLTTLQEEFDEVGRPNRSASSGRVTAAVNCLCVFVCVCCSGLFWHHFLTDQNLYKPNNRMLDRWQWRRQARMFTSLSIFSNLPFLLISNH